MTEHKLVTIAGVKCYQVPDFDTHPGSNCTLCMFIRDNKKCAAAENNYLPDKVHYVKPTAEALEAHQLWVIAQRLKS